MHSKSFYNSFCLWNKWLHMNLGGAGDGGQKRNQNSKTLGKVGAVLAHLTAVAGRMFTSEGLRWLL